jgi:2-hydroxy-3-keto-5-methylthiopentenyl-1-phosphate phosphatase
VSSLTIAGAQPGVRVLVDFDGTVALKDTTDVILERLASASAQGRSCV